MFQCKHCGNTDGFYVRQRYVGECNLYIDSDGNCDVSGLNSAMYDDARVTWTGKLAYCNSCNKSVGKVNKLMCNRLLERKE